MLSGYTRNEDDFEANESMRRLVQDRVSDDIIVDQLIRDSLMVTVEYRKAYTDVWRTLTIAFRPTFDESDARKIAHHINRDSRRDGS